jgi:hypothetical protein
MDDPNETSDAPSDRSRINSTLHMVEPPTTSRRGMAVGFALAFAIPVSYWLLATLVEHGITPYDETHALLSPLFEISLLEVLLGPIGIGIALWSGGTRGALKLAGLTVLAVPMLAVVWFLAVATLGGALGNPF